MYLIHVCRYKVKYSKYFKMAINKQLFCQTYNIIKIVSFKNCTLYNIMYISIGQNAHFY